MEVPFAKFTDFNFEPNLKIIECKFASIDEKNAFYTLAYKQIIEKAGLRDGPIFSDDKNVVSISFEPENKEFVMDFLNQHYKESMPA
jgi:hypothetical protein